MVGYSIRKIFTDKSSRKVILLIGTGILFEVCAAGLEYKQMAAGIDGIDLSYQIIKPYCPLIISASICIFIGFTLLDVKKECANLSALTFYLYLIHVGVWDVVCKVFKIVGGGGTALNGAIWIPIFVVVVFVISYLLSKVYLWIWAKLDAGRRITNWMLKAVRLNMD